jgi:hypothetical protein
MKVENHKTKKRRWFELIGDEELSFIKRFVLHSGSLKKIAKGYGVSYPTVRLRLDRIIEKMKLISNIAIKSEFETLIRLKYVDGKIDMETLKQLLKVHYMELEEQNG